MYRQAICRDRGRPARNERVARTELTDFLSRPRMVFDLARQAQEFEQENNLMVLSAWVSQPERLKSADPRLASAPAHPGRGLLRVVLRCGSQY